MLLTASTLEGMYEIEDKKTKSYQAPVKEWGDVVGASISDFLTAQLEEREKYAPPGGSLCVCADGAYLGLWSGASLHKASTPIKK